MANPPSPTAATVQYGSRVQQREEGDDIYRGEHPSTGQPVARTASLASASSASSGWSTLGLRRGRLGTILEVAINRWARVTSGSVASSSSSSSSSVRNRLSRKRTRRSSNTTSQNTHTENVIRARRMAREQGRVLPREFVFFLPTTLMYGAVDDQTRHPTPTDTPAATPPHVGGDGNGRVYRTTSLPLVLERLSFAIKRSAKLRKQKHAKNGWRNLQVEMPADDKGKFQEGLHPGGLGIEKSPRPPAWWLDISTPTWNDLREIGKLLHLHPLTLEDILHRDTREKLELFPRLGYYFVVFRALESQHTVPKVPPHLDTNLDDDREAPCMDNAIGATNVYIVVFREGICTFHFEDISEHTLRVRNRIMQLEQTFYLSSDWIAHGILDSIVDQFLPLLRTIEREVKDLDDVTLSIDSTNRDQPAHREKDAIAISVVKSKEKAETKIIPPEMEKEGKAQIISKENSLAISPKEAFRVNPLSGVPIRARWLAVTSFVRKVYSWSTFPRRRKNALSPPLMRMASTRRLVISLMRLLGTKSEVVSQIRKRLSEGTVMRSVAGSIEQGLAAEVGIYLGDIQDHILTLQQSLEHNEHRLSHSHPVYLLHLGIFYSQAKNRMDNALLKLSTIGVSIMTMQIVTGMASLNVHLPHNTRITLPPGHPAPYNYFIAILIILLMLGVGVICLTRYWWLQAKRKFARRLKP